MNVARTGRLTSVRPKPVESAPIDTAVKTARRKSETSARACDSTDATIRTPTPALLLSTLLVVLGLQLFALGLLGELIIFTHAKQIRDYQIDTVLNFQPGRVEPSIRSAT